MYTWFKNGFQLGEVITCVCD